MNMFAQFHVADQKLAELKAMQSPEGRAAVKPYLAEAEAEVERLRAQISEVKITKDIIPPPAAESEEERQLLIAAQAMEECQTAYDKVMRESLAPVPRQPARQALTPSRKLTPEQKRFREEFRKYGHALLRHDFKTKAGRQLALEIDTIANEVTDPIQLTFMLLLPLVDRIAVLETKLGDRE